MSVKYIPVQWNAVKWKYNAVMLGGVFAYLAAFIFLGRMFQSPEGRIDAAIFYARAFGSCAFLMLSAILCIGPLARLDRRFLPLLYNRRHFGVMTALVALTHAGFIVNWYFGSSRWDKYEALFFANASYGQLAGFPFEIFGAFALLCLWILAATSHDFWMKFLTPPLWKRIHFSVYFAYGALVAHIGFGALQARENRAFVFVFVICALGVAIVHLAAFFRERETSRALVKSGNRESGKGEKGKEKDGYSRVCAIADMEEGLANIALLPGGDRVAVFLHEGRLSAVSNVCAHQNGPLGEGKILRCLITCPWHGFQYNIADGRSPAPFTEMIPTYNLKLIGDEIWVHEQANAPGTYVTPLAIDSSVAAGGTERS